jgi:site-specific DNA recombinase
LIDAYSDGLVDKSEFEPRISAARARLAKLEDEHRQRIGEAAQEAELRLVIGQLEEFARRVSEGLQGPNWDTRREIVRALVKKVEVEEEEVRIVYRVSPSPFERGPQQGNSQHCWGRGISVLGHHRTAPETLRFRPLLLSSCRINIRICVPSQAQAAFSASFSQLDRRRWISPR